MKIDFEMIAPPSNDKRWRVVQMTMRQHGNQPNALIETLHSVQESFGYLDKESLRYVAAVLRVPQSRVYGVATFYHFFTLQPQGLHICLLCTGTACYIKGAPNLVADVEKLTGVALGKTTPDGQVSLMTARCLGSCGLAPAGVFDGTVVGNLSAPTVHARVEEWLSHDA
ncbi:MAG: bidirectional hydrogenase complex protein HoxE [Chloroflexi bacterium]|nr:bidirectional hydrogenase complex protein HoxE [Chloroflexota bacterium]